MRRPHLALRDRADEVNDRPNRRARHRHAVRRPRAFEPQPHAVARDDLVKGGEVLAQEGRAVVASGGRAQKPVEHAPRPHGRIEPRLLDQRLEMQREEIAEHLRRHAVRHRKRTRRIVMAGDQPPQLAADDDRDRHRGGNTHVAQVLAMDRRDTAQMREAEIERRAGGIALGQDRHAVAVRIRDHADRILEIERARLHGNVARREVLAEEALEIRPLRLRHDLSGAVRREAVDHHAVVGEQRTDETRRLRDDGIHALLRAQPADERAHEFERPALSSRRRPLDLDDRRPVPAMGRDVEQAPLAVRQGGEQHGPRSLERARERVAQVVRGLISEHLLELHADEIAAAHEIARVRRMTLDAAEGAVEGDETAMRLNAAGDMDRLAIAVRQRERVIPHRDRLREKIAPLPRKPHSPTAPRTGGRGPRPFPIMRESPSRFPGCGPGRRDGEPRTCW